ncbi:MAG: FG-GAP repeat protein, partial [Phycisphaerales bacterium]|nr:FG-GAP repeat protein [Phycisphaerales bacterium]
MRNFTPLVLAIATTALPTMPAVGQIFYEDSTILPSDGGEGDRFGASVAISGDTGIIGAYLDTDNNIINFRGAAYLFDIASGQQLFKLLPDDQLGRRWFGYSVGISGSAAIVGVEELELAYLFDTTNGQQLFELQPNDTQSFDNFGDSVDISGNIAIVGASENDDNGNQSGSAYLFNVSSGQQIVKLLPNDGEPLDRFGIAVAISGSIAVVGASWDSDNGNQSGSAYLFDTTTGQQIAKLLPNDGAADDYFGGSVAIDGNTVIVGARWNDDNGNQSGSAYLFDTTTGQQIAKLLPNDGAAGDYFGESVAIHGTKAVVGAHLNYHDEIRSGAAYLFDITTGQQIAKFVPSIADRLDWFGSSVALNEETVVIGASGVDDIGDNSGAAYSFNLPCPPDISGDGNLNFLDVSAFLTAFGNQD